MWRNFTFGFALGDITFSRRSASISVPNFVRTTQSTAEIKRTPLFVKEAEGQTETHIQ